MKRSNINDAYRLETIISTWEKRLDSLALMRDQDLLLADSAYPNLSFALLPEDDVTPSMKQCTAQILDIAEQYMHLRIQKCRRELEALGVDLAD